MALDCLTAHMPRASASRNLSGMAVVEEVAPERTWPAVFAPLAFASGFGGAILGGVLVGVIAAITGASLRHPPPVVSLVGTVLQDAAFVISAVFFAARVARPAPAQFGLRSTRLWRAIWTMAVGYLAFFIFEISWVSALAIHDKERLVDQLGVNDNAVALVAVCLLTCAIAPICEEFFFRGFFFTALRNWRGPWTAAVVTGAVFGAIHAGSAPLAFLVPLAVFGFVLCIVYWKAGSLYPCIVLHALNNSVALGITEHWWWWQILILAAAALAAIAAALAGVARIVQAE